MLTQTQIETTSLTLHVELQEARGGPVSPLSVGNQLAIADFAGGMAALQGNGDGLNKHAVLRAEPRLMQAKFGSPLIFDIALPGGLAENALGLTFLIYAFKRL